MRRGARGTSMAFFKARVDGLNYAEFVLPNYHPSSFDQEIGEIRFRHNLVAVLKADNRKPSNVKRPHPVSWSSWFRSEGHGVARRILDLTHTRAISHRLLDSWPSLQAAFAGRAGKRSSL